jgi:DNA excision repair protein ERCC-3
MARLLHASMDRTGANTGVRTTNQAAIAFQRSGDILLDTRNDQSGEVEDLLRQFAELRSAAGTLHTYSISDLSLWTAAASGLDGSTLVELLSTATSNRIPGSLLTRINTFFSRYGQITIEGFPDALILTCDDPVLLREIANLADLPVTNGNIELPGSQRGRIKAKLAEAGYPVVDNVRPALTSSGGYSWNPEVELRDYQANAVSRFVEHASDGGVILLPCGAGKTVVGVAIAARLDARVLVITPNRTIGEQWADHFRQMTTLSNSEIERFPSFPGEQPVTVVTYQALTSSQSGVSARLHDATDIPWGLIIYDEVHTLPADVFRHSAALQSRRRLGLTATLVREDGREREVYGLVGPPVWQSRWRELERAGWISPVECFEVRVRTAGDQSRGDRGFAAKIRTIERLIEKHPEDRVLIAAHYVREVEAIARRLGVPSVTGQTPHAERKRLFDAFRAGEVKILAVSRVANVGVDLPDANVMIQASGTFGSRLEEAQRLGRLLRPKETSRPARFYSLILPETRERQFAERRQRYLVEQGYHYQVVNARG